ncbi:MAG: DAK2 domain-containing protein [Clostridia bacterium]|nr:DAK2 domain-containing protein [Clostridia bacterium]
MENNTKPAAKVADEKSKKAMLEAEKKAEADKKKKAEAEKKKADADKKKKAEADKKKKAEADKKKKAEADKKKKAEADKKKKAEADKKKKAEESKKKGGGPIKFLTGFLFAKMMKGGANELRAHADTVNKLNVFPVPDGDTGDNMSMTIESGVAALESMNSDSLAHVMKAASKGMLLGARGNSGVILSQFFAGIAKHLEEADEADPATMGKALEAGVDRAYASVMTPMEGTILTVARESVEYAISRITPRSTIRTLFADLVKEMHAAVERTPETLAVLKEAGVVDSGGAGLFYIIDGLNKVLNGEELTQVEASAAPTPVQNAAVGSGFGPDSVMTYGYCTELLVQLQNAKCDIEKYDVEELKAYLSGLGDSIVAFKTDSIVKIHVHTLTPELVLAHMREVGEFLTVKIENMSVQHSELIEDEGEESGVSDADRAAALKDAGFAAPKPAEAAIAVEEAPAERKRYGIVAVATGDGLKSIFTELGTDYIVDGGQTNNPSTSDFIEAFGKINAEDIFVLPGNSNIIMAANQAAEIYTEARVHVIKAKTIGHSYVALSSYDPEAESAEMIIEAAESAIEAVTTGYISPSIRDTAIDGVSIRSGDTIGVIGKEIVVSAQKQSTATCALINAMLFMGDKFLFTVFVGKDVDPEERAKVEEYVSSHFPDVECYFLEGGQEVYPYLFVAE